MSAPLSGTTTRVVGFFKGLFGKGNSDSAPVQADVAYDYHQVTPVTGAQLKAPAPSAAPTPIAAKSARVSTQQRNVTGQGVSVPVSITQPGARPSGNLNGFIVDGHSSGHVNGVAIAPHAVTPKLAAQTTVAPNPPAPASFKQSNGNGSHAPVAPTPKPISTSPGKYINLPLAPVFAALPLELQARVIKKEFGDHSLAISLEIVFPQLSTGVVKIPFALIREGAPQFFKPATDADQTLVTLPLAEIFRQISPAQLAKPDNQVRITADADVTSPFADKGNNVNLEVKSSARPRSVSLEATGPTPARQSLGQVSTPSAPPAKVTPPVRINVPIAPPAATKVPAPVAPATPPAPSAPIAMPKAQFPTPSPAPAAVPAAPVAPKASATTSAPIAMPKVQPPTPTSAPAPVAPPIPKINGVSSLRMVSTPSEPAPAPAPAPATVPPSTPAPAAKPATNQATLTVALKSLVDAWPAAVKQEILDHNLLNGSVDLPLDSVAAQLKNGRVAFTWDLIRSWISPRPGGESAHGPQEIELPLMVMAPLFLGLKNTDGAKSKRLTADDCIPDVFAPASKPAALATPTPAPEASTPIPASAPPAAPTPMTPDAVVKRAAALQGVAGALVALPDGLVVASKLPPGLNADSLAAFLPQIYAKFDACLKELSMDGLNNLNFTAGTVPWRVYRTGSVLFAVFGRANEPLPGDWLATLAGELEKK